VTNGGTAFVALLGFISILVLTAVSGSAGYVTLAIVDDFFVRRNIRNPTKGWTSVIFWLFNLFLSMSLLGAEVKALYSSSNGDDIEPFTRHLWVAFTSITSIEFGDTYKPYESFRQIDMFYIPFVMLLGCFVCLTISS